MFKPAEFITLHRKDAQMNMHVLTNQETDAFFIYIVDEDQRGSMISFNRNTLKSLASLVNQNVALIEQIEKAEADALVVAEITKAPKAKKKAPAKSKPKLALAKSTKKSKTKTKK